MMTGPFPLMSKEPGKFAYLLVVTSGDILLLPIWR